MAALGRAMTTNRMVLGWNGYHPIGQAWGYYHENGFPSSIRIVMREIIHPYIETHPELEGVI